MKENYITDHNLNNNFVYWIGVNAQDNWNIIDKADKTDIWFHLSDHPSAHVILRTENISLKKISKQTLKKCALECKIHSKFNFSNKQKMKIIYTEIRNISKDDKIGLAYTKKNKYLFV